MAGAQLFDVMTRTDRRPRRFGETTHQFFNRSASSYFGVVRDLLEEWLSHVPAEHRHDLVRRLQKADASHRAAFWELYLHEGYRRSGYEIVIHPKLEHSPNRPDFRMEGPEGAFYLEAIRVGEAPGTIAADHRLDAVHQVIADLRIQDFTLVQSTACQGQAPLSTKKLRRALTEWIAGLDVEEVSAAINDERVVGLRALPQLRWQDEGWDVTFSAGPLNAAARGVDRSALGVMFSGGAGVVDNKTGLRRALTKKHGRYGPLDLPFVIAVESMTEIPTHLYQVEQVLYGLSALRPTDVRRQPSGLAEEGFWFGRDGWCHGDTPQVIVSQGIHPGTVGKQPANLWTTIEDGVVGPGQPAWLHRVAIGGEPVSVPGAGLVEHFGLDRDWAERRPDFDES